MKGDDEASRRDYSEDSRSIEDVLLFYEGGYDMSAGSSHGKEDKNPLAT